MQEIRDSGWLFSITNMTHINWQKKSTYPAIILQNTVIFPGERTPLVLEGKENIETIQKVLQNDRIIALQFRPDDQASHIGVRSKILHFWFFKPNVMGLVIEAEKRIEIIGSIIENNISKIQAADIEEEPLNDEESNEIEAIARSVFERFKQLVQLAGIMPLTVAHQMQKDTLQPDEISDVVSAAIGLKTNEKVELLENLETKKRLEYLSSKLSKELNIAKTEQKIQQEVDKEMDKVQRDYILREHLKAVEKELGIFEEQKEYEELETKLKKTGMPKDILAKSLKELQRLKNMPPISAETPFIRTYLDIISELPWNKVSKATIDLKKSQQILDADHYGLQKVKERILEHLAVQKLTKGKDHSNILCFYGPPGTGKTSVGQSIAKALGRKFIRISLGGIHDEAEIRGHRRTYVGALPGRIIQSLRSVGTKNPVLMIDEVDKIGSDFRGDPSAALLEVLDPEQNHTFTDNYLEVPFDLSQIFFITTANILDTIPSALRDRMEEIEFSGYSFEEKLQITKFHLLPKVIKTHGLQASNFHIQDEALKKIIARYTHEAGVRDLERKLAEIARKTARKIAEKKARKKTIITGENLSSYLGNEEYVPPVREEKDEIGVAVGVAWTPAGGEVIFIEATLVPGKGSLTLTGQLGKVMQESAKAALSYVRSKSKTLSFDQKFYQQNDVHIHVPAGGIQKDGPSAGIAIATALASAVTKRKVKKEVALTGEITLSGKILKVGGIKEKILAAARAGSEIIIMPETNKPDLEYIPKEIRRNLSFKFVKHMNEVLKVALL